MSEAIITVENLGKRYSLRHNRPERYTALRDVIAAKALAPVRSLRAKVRNSRSTNARSTLPTFSRSHSSVEDFWALKNVSFEVKRGEVVGIIGRNGAGKSTLLKILSRITAPTEGRVKLKGRVASLLEVGTGFHPELTGRENIYLNGAILGMSRAEIRKRFDEIVAFAETEKFLDTPVKRYSSGMYVRLAFAVAAHLEPEILLVDEVLAVGDVAFQRKCLGRMQEVSRHDGRTILFVSHNLHAVRRLCSKALFFSQGKAEYFGSVPHAIDLYCAMSAPTVEPLPNPTSDLLNQAFLTGFSLETKKGPAPSVLPIGAYWQARVQFTVGRKMDEFVIGLGVVANDGTPVQTAWSERMIVQPGSYEAVFGQDHVILAAGSYDLLVGISQRGQSIQQIRVARLDVSPENAEGSYELTSGAGMVLNSMKINVSVVEPGFAEVAGQLTNS
jgi:lipopolysaccharide transport system ATP-binding protein